MKMPELFRDAGHGAVLLHQQVERGSVDWPLLLRQENRARKGSAHLEPGAERPGFLRAPGGARRSWSPSAGVERVQDWIGHANIQSTMEYAKVTNARRDDMAQQLKEM